jgi:hypothetical protein
MKARLIFVLLLLITQFSCQTNPKKKLAIPVENQLKNTNDSEEKKSSKMTIESGNSSTFNPANTSGNFSKGKGSEKKFSTEKPNRNRVLQDNTRPLQPPLEFVDETTDPAFFYSNPDRCETILTDTVN